MRPGRGYRPARAGSVVGMGFVREERAALAATLGEVGPDAPTLCAGWTARDLAAHLVLREGRPDAMPGILLPPLRGYTARVQDRIAAGDFDALRDKIRTGPPWYSPFRLVDEQANLTEYVVHHEDVRRGGADWSPREISDSLAKALWKAAGAVAKIGYRGIGVPVRLERTGGGIHTVGRGDGEPVVIRGEPMELLLHAFGRDAVSVTFDGPADAIAAVESAKRGF